MMAGKLPKQAQRQAMLHQLHFTPFQVGGEAMAFQDLSDIQPAFRQGLG